MTPEDTFLAAEARMRNLAQAAHDDVATSAFWSEYGPATAWQDGLSNGWGGITAEYISAMPPAVGLAMADLFNIAASYASRYPADHQASTRFLAGMLVMAEAVVEATEPR